MTRSMPSTDKDDSNTVSFAEFVDQFSKNQIPASDVVNLGEAGYQWPMFDNNGLLSL